MSLEAMVTKTGPLGATMSAMTVDMIGPGGLFGRLDLPEVKTSSKGATVKVTKQKIAILDQAAFVAFVRALMLEDKVTLQLDNGAGKIKSWGMSSNIVYKKTVDIAGMQGPKTELVATDGAADGGFTNTMKTINPSPLEIDLGVATFAFVSADGEVLAEHKGKMYIPRGEGKFPMTGKVIKKGNVNGIKLVGTGVDADAWTKETVKIFDFPVELTPQLASLISS